MGFLEGWAQGGGYKKARITADVFGGGLLKTTVTQDGGGVGLL
jgi:hypothetical protein